MHSSTSPGGSRQCKFRHVRRRHRLRRGGLHHCHHAQASGVGVLRRRGKTLASSAEYVCACPPSWSGACHVEVWVPAGGHRGAPWPLKGGVEWAARRHPAAGVPGAGSAAHACSGAHLRFHWGGVLRDVFPVVLCRLECHHDGVTGEAGCGRESQVARILPTKSCSTLASKATQCDPGELRRCPKKLSTSCAGGRVSAKS